MPRSGYSALHGVNPILNRSISSVDWNFLFQGTSVRQKVTIFNEHLMNIFHNFIPNKIIKCGNKQHPR